MTIKEETCKNRKIAYLCRVRYQPPKPLSRRKIKILKYQIRKINLYHREIPKLARWPPMSFSACLRKVEKQGGPAALKSKLIIQSLGRGPVLDSRSVLSTKRILKTELMSWLTSLRIKLFGPRHRHRNKIYWTRNWAPASFQEILTYQSSHQRTYYKVQELQEETPKPSNHPAKHSVAAHMNNNSKCSSRLKRNRTEFQLICFEKD